MRGYTIYDSPVEAPGHYVLRLWYTAPGGKVVHGEAIATDRTEKALTTLRRSMIEMGLVRFPRSPEDDPCIIETWL
jgi:hypothetical protein